MKNKISVDHCSSSDEICQLGYQLVSLLYACLDDPTLRVVFFDKLSEALDARVDAILAYQLADGSSTCCSREDEGAGFFLGRCEEAFGFSAAEKFSGAPPDESGFGDHLAEMDKARDEGDIWIIPLERDLSSNKQDLCLEEQGLPIIEAGDAEESKIPMAGQLLAVASVDGDCLIQLRLLVGRETSSWYEPGKQALLKYVMPHFASMHRIQFKQQVSAGVLQSILTIHNMVPFPLLLWREDRRQLRCNPQAARLLANISPKELCSEDDWQIHQSLGDAELVSARRKLRLPLRLLHELAKDDSYQVFVFATVVPGCGVNAGLLKNIYGLNSAEAELCFYVVQGHTPKQIAQALNCSIHTVKSRFKRVYRACGVSSTAQLAARLLFHPCFWAANYGQGISLLSHPPGQLRGDLA